MMKNKLLIVLMFTFIPSSLIWSSATKSVIAETSVAQTLETQESDIEANDEVLEQNKTPLLPADTTEITTQDSSTKLGVESFSTTGSKIHSYSSQLAEKKNVARAACSLVSWRTGSAGVDNNAEISCTIKDMGDDGDTVYVDWWIDGYKSVRLSNTKGYNTVTNETDARRVPQPFIKVYWKVCSDVSFGRDKCSDTKSWERID